MGTSRRAVTAIFATFLVIAAVAGLAAAATAACTGVRPGAEVVTKAGSCTLNFVWRGSDRRTYAGTAGHCVPGESPDEEISGEHTYRPAGAPTAEDPDGNRIGKFAYAVLDDPKDFSLIRLRKSVTPNPQMCRFGGPTGINSDITDETTTLNFYGNGALIGQASPARSLTAFGMPDPDLVHAQGPIAPGDSGSGVTTEDGRAVGVLVTLGYHEGPAGFGVVGITRFAPQLQAAQTALDIRLRLVKAPLL